MNKKEHLNSLLKKIWDVDLIDGPEKITFRDLYDNFLGLSEPQQCAPNPNPTTHKKVDESSFPGKDREWVEKKICEEEGKDRIENLNKDQYEKWWKIVNQLPIADWGTTSPIPKEVYKYQGGWEPKPDKNNVVYHERELSNNDRFLLLGEYLPHSRKIVLYLENIKTVVGGDSENFNYCYITTLVHELHHALFHHKTIVHGKDYNYIREIEEPITEMSTLMFIEKLVNETGLDNGCLEYAKNSIQDKLKPVKYKGYNEPVTNAAYGLGYYLFEQEDINNKKLFKNYIKKLGNLDANDPAVKDYVLNICPYYPDNDITREIVANSLCGILL